MKKRSLFALTAALLICLCCFSACSSASSTGKPISPALNCIAEQNAMAKSALLGNAISFSADDFARALNLSKLDKLTITSLPPVSDGELRVGSTVLTSPQTLSAASLSLMTYHAASGITSSSFCFKVDGMPTEMRCELYMLEKKNYAPTLSVAPKTALEVSTHQNITFYGTLPCYDPDGDKTYIDIVSYPEKGVLILEDKTTGSYRYIPNGGSRGADSFCYVARDKYGNYSPSATVSLTIDKTATSLVFSDLKNDRCHNAALTMAEAGIMNGTQVGSSVYFYPEKAVSREEFTVMAMNAMGIKELPSTSATVFADDADISSDMKKYIASAYELDYISGTQKDGKLCFEPKRAITRAEAAVMLANMLNAAAPTFKPVFSDTEAIPTWAETSVYSLSALGVFHTQNGSVNAASELTRGDAAMMLSGLMEVKSNP